MKGNAHLIVCFGGRALKFGGILPFEFLNYLSITYTTDVDFVFLIDKNQCWYHKGIADITNNIDETIVHLNTIVAQGNYKKVLFMGISAGGYAAILFGSLCNKVDGVIAFMPQTILKNPIDEHYTNLRTVLNTTTKYMIHGHTGISNIHDIHHISHCENIEDHSNVTIIRQHGCNMKVLRDTGVIKKYIDDMLFG